MTRPPTTSSQVPRDGLDRPGRAALIRCYTDLDLPYKAIFGRFIREEGYADAGDYFDCVSRVQGVEAQEAILESLQETARAHTVERLDWETGEREALNEFGPLGVLLAMPEGDFLTALELSATMLTDGRSMIHLTTQLNKICTRRGISYVVEHTGGRPSFAWQGEPAVAELATIPAIRALADPRLSGGPRTEWEQARAELRLRSPQSLKQAVAEACNAVESTLKVLIADHAVAIAPNKQNANDLWTALKTEDPPIVAKEMEEAVLAASRFGNRRGRHGAGSLPHTVTEAEAEAIVASAAVAIAYLAGLVKD